MSQPTSASFTAYSSVDYTTIAAGPLALYSVNVDSILPTQLNEGYAEVGYKAAGYDRISTLSALENSLLGDIEPVVIGPGGQLYLLDGHHTFTALIDSVWGSQNPNVYVNVVANYSNLSTSQFFATMQANSYLLPLNNGVAETVNDATGSPIPTSLTGLTNNVYRGLEYSILKNQSSKLFAGAASTPGLDKMPGLYSDFLEAAAYQGANSGLGLAYLSPYDISTSTSWNLSATSATSLPGIGSVTAGQLPGFILTTNITVSSVISNATLGQSSSNTNTDPNGHYETGALADNGTSTGAFTGVTEINAGTVSNPILIGTANIGFIMQLGYDGKKTATLSNTANTYSGGTTILAGHLIVASDGSLGAAPTETLAQFNASLTFDAEGTPNNVTAAVQADNGIIFNSLSEGNGTLTLGTTTGGTFTTSRPIAVGNEVATLDVNGNTVTLNGPLITLPNDTVGLGNTASFPSLTIDDLSSGGTATATAGKVVLSTASPYFYGDIIIGNTGAPTVEVMNDAALGNTSTINGSSLPIGQIELNGGTLQTGASFTASERNIVLDGSSQIDLDGQTTTWGTLTDTKRSIEIGNSSGTAGAITFGSFNISQTSTLQLDGKAAGTTYTGTETVTFTNGVQQTAATDTLIITTTTATALGTTQKVFSGVGSSTLVHGIGPAWIVSDNGGGASGNAYNFVTYGSNGYVAATYTDTGSGSGSGISTATSSDIVDQNTTNSTTLTADAYAYALKVNDAAVITATGHTITLGDGTDPAGLIMDGGSAAITGGTLAFGGSEAIIYAKGTSTISAAITGTNGLVIAGTGTINLGAAASGLSGAVTIDSGTLNLTVANVFSSDTGGLLLDDVKSTPAPSTLNFTTNQTFTTLSSVGNNSSVTFSSGATLTIGDTTNNLSSTLSSGITETGTATTGALTFNGSGLFDLSGMSSGALTLVTNSTVVVNNSAQLRIASKIFSTTPTGVSVTLNGTSQLQFTQSGGGKFANNITGTGEVHLIGGTLQLTGTGNTYSGGTVVEIGSTLDLTTANVSTGNANITDAGGLIVFDQSTTGTYSGVISDGLEMGTGPSETGSLDKDDSSGSNTGNLILSSAQTYTGATYVETGTLTLGAANTVADSSGVTLGRVGGGGSAILALGANNQLSALSSNSGNFDQVQLNGHTLTLTPGSTVSSNFGGVIANGTGTGNVIVDAAGTVTLGGNNTYSGGTTVEAGTLSIGAANNIGTGTLTLDNGTTVDLTAGFTLTQAITVAGDPTFEVASGQTDTITGLISDGASPGIVELTGGGTLDLDNAANSYSGGTTIAGGSTLELGVAGAAGSGSITFSGTADTLKIDGTTMPSNTIAGFVSGDTFDISSLNYDGVGTANLLAGNVLEIFEPGHTYDLQLDPTQHFTGDYFHLASDGNGGTVVTEDTTPCYCRGTRIRTPGGDVPVEDLRIGDLVSIAGGPALPLKWVGRRSYSDWLAVGNDDIQPILFKAGSIADGVPARDLYVSPDHAMLMDGMLVPAHCLVNGVSIVKIAGMDRVEYFHLEFHRHVVIFAEGATAESFVDDDSRMLFHNADEYRRLYPCERRPAYAEFCAPRVDEGSELEALRRALSIRAGHPRPGGAASADVQSRPAVTAARLPQADHAAASQIAM